MNSEILTSPQTIIAALYVVALAAFLGYQVISEFSRLSSGQKLRVLAFARSLVSAPQQNRGDGRALLQYAGTIQKDDLPIIEQVIGEGCERISTTKDDF